MRCYMCITIRKIGLGNDVQEIYHKKKEENYHYEKLPENKLFYNLFSLKKDDLRFIVGSNKKNKTSMFVLSESFEKERMNDIYVKYLELFFKIECKPMPDHVKSKFSTDDEFKLLNGAMNANGDMVILGTMADPKNESKNLWLTIVISPSLMGYRIPERSRYSSTASGDACRSMDIWDMLGTAGTVAGIFTLFG